MRAQNIPQNQDIGFTDTLIPGVGRAVGGRLNADCYCSMSGGSSYVVTISAGVIWMQDVAGTYTGIANSLIRQVQATSTTVTLATNGGANPRVDIVVARLGTQGWGGAPTFAVVQGAATAGADARNLKGAGALSAGDVPLVVVAVPVGSAPAAFGARVSTGVAEDARRLATDLATPGAEKSHAGFGPNGTGGWGGGAGGSASSPLPPVGYKFEDGGIYGSITNGPWNDLVTELAQTWGGAAGQAQVPDTRGRARIGAGSGGGLTARTLGSQSIGGEGHSHTLSGNGGAVNHSHPLSGNGAAASHTHSTPSHSHSLSGFGGAQVSVGSSVVFGASSAFSYGSSGSESWTSPVSSGSKGSLAGVALYGSTDNGGASSTGASGGLALSGNTDGSGTVGLTGSTDSNAQGSMQPSSVSCAIIKI